MRIKPTILSTHLFKTFLGPFVSGFIFLTFIILIFYLKDVIKSAVEKNMPIDIVISLFTFALGWTITLTIPMSALMATIMSVGSLNTDSEIIAMRAGGITYPRIFRPFFIVGIVLTIFMLWFQADINAYCMKQMRVMMERIFDYDPIAVIEPGQFTTLDKSGDIERHIFIDNVISGKNKRPDRLINVQIRSIIHTPKMYRLQQLIVAREGEKILKVHRDGKKMKAIRLFKGYLFNMNNEDKSLQRVDFMNGFLDIHIRDLDHKQKKIEISMPQALSWNELNAEITHHSTLHSQEAERKYIELRVERQKRIALPFASLAFIILGFPIAIVNRRSGKGMGFGISMIFIFIYYVLFLSADSLSVQTGILSPWTAAWLANIVSVLIGLFAFYRRTVDIPFVSAVHVYFENMKKKFSRKKH